MISALLLSAVSARGPGFTHVIATQSPDIPLCTAAETFTGLDETTKNPQFCPAYNKNCRNMYPTTAVGGTPCYHSCTKYLDMHWCYTEDCAANPNAPCAWGWCMKNADQECPLEAPPIPEDESCPFICSAYAGVEGHEEKCGGEGTLQVDVECAAVYSPAVRFYDDEKPYVMNPNPKDKGRGREAGAAWFNFKCCEDVAKFEVELEIITIGGGANSFWLYVDDVRKQFGWRVFHTEWQWAKPPMSWAIEAGCHNFIVDDREPGTKFRNVRLVGEAAEKCHFSAHTAEQEFAVASRSSVSAAMSAAYAAKQAVVDGTTFTTEDLAVYGFASIGLASLLYYSFQAIKNRSRKYSPINEVERPQYGA